MKIKTEKNENEEMKNYKIDITFGGDLDDCCDECDCDECDCDECECDECECDCDECECDECFDEDYEDDEDFEDINEDEDMFLHCVDDFSYPIKERGNDYYENGHVLRCIKNGSDFKAKVSGSRDKPYEVNIYSSSYDVDYDCTCPCDYPCKHIYATLLAIANGEYTSAELKNEISKKTYNTSMLLEILPPEEIKEYLLSKEGQKYVRFNWGSLSKYFKKYMPKQEYEYYYNNLYNELIFNEEYGIYNYLEEVKTYIKDGSYVESFKIIKAIIEAYKDAEILNEENILVENIPSIAMYLRICYRNSDELLEEEIEKWINSMVENNYYNNVYIEDMIISME